MRLIDVPMCENDVNAKTVGGFLKMLLLRLWEEVDGFSGKRPFGNSDWQYQVYQSLIEAGYDIGCLDEDGYVADVDYTKADKLIMDAISEVFETAPTIDLEELRPKGRWVCLEAEIGFYACSECDHRILRAKCNYCPNCGAKMLEFDN